MIIRPLPLALLLLTGQSLPQSPPAVSTVVLTGPEGGKEAFEPSVAIDPKDPRRVVVAAMYGNPGARGGRAIWTWETRDGGQRWNARAIREPEIGSKTAGWAADVIAGFGTDGATVITSIAGASAPRTEGLGGIIVSRRSPGDSAFGAATMVMRDRALPGNDRVLGYDKPWMATDHFPRSPYRGRVYVVSGILDMLLPKRSWSETPVDLSEITILGLDLAVSNDNGTTFGPVRRVADSAFGADLAVSADGTVEMVYPKLVAGRSAIVHLRSTDGGASFAPPISIAAARNDTVLGNAMIAATPNGKLMACWSESSGSGAGAGRLACRERGSGGWTTATIGVLLPPGVTFAFPTLAGTDRAWYLLLHLIASTRTDVILLRSDGRSDFATVARLAEVPELGISRWCFERKCRFATDTLFMAGDYASLAASGGRIAAAYVLPRPGGKLFGRAAVYLSLVSEP